MPIFVLLPQDETGQQRLPAAVQRVYPEAHKKLANHNWLVAAKGTAQEISASLGITSLTDPAANAVGAVMVLEIASYYGRATADIWDWVKAKWEATGG